MKCLIYGTGAVGLGLASCLLKSQAGVCLIARADTTTALQQGGLSRTGIFGEVNAKHDSFAAYERLDDIKNEKFDYILVCTKSFDSAAAAEDLSQHQGLFAQNTKIILCQNGWGNAEKFLAHFPKGRVYSARVITGFTRRKPNEVEITVHADAIHIGSLFGCSLDAVEPIAKAIAAGGIECITVDAIEKDLWAKMLYNCALNPLGAILGVPYGALAENKWSKNLMNRITEEVFRVMTAAGFRTHWQSADDFLKVFYDKLVPDTAGHKSSTLQSIATGRKTEIDALTGQVLLLAEKHKIDVPCNHAIFSIIKFLENRP